MRVYLDMCCLKRPFDDQGQTRIRMECEAVLALLGGEIENAELVRSAALDLENDQNPLPARAAKVRLWLESMPLLETPESMLVDRVAELMAMGFKNFDALHVASAESMSVNALATCDDRFLATSRRHAGSLKVRILNPIDLIREVVQ